MTDRLTETAVNADELLAEQLKAMASPTRLCILRTLLSHPRGSLSVDALSRELALAGCDVEQSTLSHHLHRLSKVGLIELGGKLNTHRNYYVVCDGVLVPLSALFTELAELAEQQQETGREC